MEISLYWEERGNGTPLVLLHGNGEDGTYFARQMEEFSRDFRVLAVDTRGHGRSPRGTAPFTLDQFAEDLKDFLDGRGIPVHVGLGAVSLFVSGALGAPGVLLLYGIGICAWLLG